MASARTLSSLLALFAVGAAACGGDAPAPTPPATPAASASPTTGDWPMYGHDTGRTNYNRTETVIGPGSVSRLEQRFQAPIGIGGLPSSSGPVVVAGRVYVGSSTHQGADYFCLDAATGARIWSADIGHASFDGNVGVGSTAAVVDGVVYVGGGDAAYYALEAQTGRILWRHPMNVADDAFAWSSPLVAGGAVYVGMSARYLTLRSELRALDASTGGTLARQFLVPEGREGADLWNSAALSPDGRTVVTTTGNDARTYDGPYSRAMLAFDAVSLAIQGVHQEAFPREDLDFGTTPVVFRDAASRALVGANQKDGRFYAYDLANLGQGPVWQRATGVAIGAMPAFASDIGPGGTLFIVGDNGLLFGVDPATGADRWPPLAVGFANGNIAVANGLVFMGAGTGSVAVIQADSGTLLRVLTPASPARTFSGVVVSGGTIYSVSGPHLNAWSAPSTGSAPGPNPNPRARIEMSIEPDPVVSGRGASTARSARWRVVLRETAGVGGVVNFLNAKLRDAVSGAVAVPSGSLALGSAELAARAGGNRMPPNGRLEVEESLDYGFVSGRTDAVLTLAAQFADDNGHIVTATARADVR